MNRSLLVRAAIVAAVLAAVAVVYWPVRHAAFIWDDTIAFHDAAWLRYGDAWWQYLQHGLNGWLNYFRPLVVALFALQVRAFDVQAGPMHLVSLALHLANTALVGALAARLAANAIAPQRRRWLVAAAMLVYGLHPALVEPVVWISCQFELVTTLFTLLALYANLAVQRPILRAAVVSACFFLAACAKESAVSLPLLLLISDVAAEPPGTWRALAARVWQRQKWVYVGMLVAGVAYLALRHVALGFLLQPIGQESLFSLTRWQKAAFTYVTYWRIALWPMTGAGPLHVIDDQRFAGLSASALADDAAALAILALGVFGFLRRRRAGAMMLAFSAGLLPVLHIVPVAFVESVYHERYVMIALAVLLAWLPATLDEIVAARPLRPLAAVAAGLATAAWLLLAVLNIRVTIPLWSDELSLWQWALRQDPDSIIVKDHLLAELMARDDPRAHTLADELVAAKVRCPNCLLNAAYVALAEQDAARAQAALALLQQTNVLAYDTRLLHGFVLASGQLRELQQDPKGAEDAYRDAITSDPYDPMGYAQLAFLLAQQGRLDEARKAADSALQLFAPDRRERYQKLFDQALRAPAATPLKPG